MKIECTTLCYLLKDDACLMLHRVKKEHDVNKDKWIGVGGHMEAGESPEDCVRREVREETGYTLLSWKFHGIITFVYGDVTEYMMLYTSDSFTADDTAFLEDEAPVSCETSYESKSSSDSITVNNNANTKDKTTAPETHGNSVPTCDEGVLEWVPLSELPRLNLWAGDYIFLQMVEDGHDFFSLKLVYDDKGLLREAVLDGKPMELFDVLDDDGHVTGYVQERQVVHRLGLRHMTVHLWLHRVKDGYTQLLFQKRSAHKDSNPGCYDISSAGHIDAGDEPLPSAIRELSEELGIQAAPEEFRFIGLCPNYSEKEFYGHPFRDNELSYVYLVDKKADIADMTLQASEVESVMWMDIDEVIRRQRDGSLKNCLHDVELEMVRDALINPPKSS